MKRVNQPEYNQWYPLDPVENDLAKSLPIFYKNYEGGINLYSPGYVISVDDENKNAFIEEIRCPDKTKTWKAANELIQHAVDAKDTWEKHLSELYTPTCLTLYLNNQCNLKCRYCYSNATPFELKYLDSGAALSGAKIVLENCIKLSLPFTVVFHGGGEPLLNKHLAETILDGIDRITSEHDVQVFRYIATNGVMSIQKAEWMAERFEMIGISCDGPAFIQNYNRPMMNGENTSNYVERTARIVRGTGKRLLVRVTLTPDSFEYQPEIAEYISQTLKPDEIHVEAIYHGGRTSKDGCFSVAQAEKFVDKYFMARQIAAGYGITWTSSGSRPPEIHGPYCNINRKVLNVIPGGFATACFKTVSLTNAIDSELVIGTFEKEVDNNRWVINYPHIRELQKRLDNIQIRCRNCINQYHCTFSCPDFCSLDGSIGDQLSFRCAVQKRLTDSLIDEFTKKYRSTQIPIIGVTGGPVMSNQ